MIPPTCANLSPWGTGHGAILPETGNTAQSQWGMPGRWVRSPQEWISHPFASLRFDYLRIYFSRMPGTWLMSYHYQIFFHFFNHSDLADAHARLTNRCHADRNQKREKNNQRLSILIPEKSCAISRISFTPNAVWTCDNSSWFAVSHM